MAAFAVQRLKATAEIAEITNTVRRDGAVILSGLMASNELQVLRREVEPEFHDAKFCDGLFFGARTKRVHSLVKKSASCRNMILAPLVTSVIRQLLLPYCDKIQLNLTQGIQIWPGEKPQFLHRDDAMFPAKQWCCEYLVNAMWACSEFTKENGATVVAPGSHLWKDRTLMPTRPEETTQAEMEPGEVLIYLGSLIHGGGGNNSSSVRTGIAIGYSLGWLRQYENQYLIAPPETARNYPPELQELLGYRVHRPNLGMYEGCEPNILFNRSEEFVTHDFLNDEQTMAVAQYVSSLERGAA